MQQFVSFVVVNIVSIILLPRIIIYEAKAVLVINENLVVVRPKKVEQFR